MPARTVSSPVALTGDAIAAMTRALQDEYQAEAIYERVVADFGNVLPFFNIVNAEERHSAAIAWVFQNRGISVPASLWNADNVPRFQTIRDACAGAEQEEISNIEMYDQLVEMDLPDDVERVFGNNRRASLESHLPAFRLCAGN
jgi:hypothetical protein